MRAARNCGTEQRIVGRRGLKRARKCGIEPRMGEEVDCGKKELWEEGDCERHKELWDRTEDCGKKGTMADRRNCGIEQRIVGRRGP